MHDNILRLIRIAKGLGDLCEEMVFVGGAVTALYADDAAAPDIRPTTDVDCVTELATYGNYENLENRLRQKGFKNDIESGVICRWKYKGETVDIMPDDKSILGFSNPWYIPGYNKRILIEILPDLKIYILPVLYFLAAKIEALCSRGGNDWRFSHDFEDIIFVLNNNKDIKKSFDSEENQELRSYISSWAKEALNRNNHREEIECALPYGEEGREEYIFEILKYFSD